MAVYLHTIKASVKCIHFKWILVSAAASKGISRNKYICKCVLTLKELCLLKDSFVTGCVTTIWVIPANLQPPMTCYVSISKLDHVT